jgi:hypothetical protein
MLIDDAATLGQRDILSTCHFVNHSKRRQNEANLEPYSQHPIFFIAYNGPNKLGSQIYTFCLGRTL